MKETNATLAVPSRWSISFNEVLSPVRSFCFSFSLSSYICLCFFSVHESDKRQASEYVRERERENGRLDEGVARHER